MIVKTLLAIAGLALAIQAQIVHLPYVVSTPDGVVAGFSDIQVRWWGLESSEVLKCEAYQPYGFSGPILGTRVRDLNGDEIKVFNFYPNTGLLAPIFSITGQTWRWDYLTAAYPQGEVTITAYGPAVPEPEGYALFAGLGLCAFAVWRRRNLT
jgi:hypothetical protein